MDSSLKTPSFNEVLQVAFDAFSQGLHTCTAGVIETYDPQSNTCSISLANKRVYKSISGLEFVYEEVPILTNVPVLFNGGGGIRLTYPIVKGDTCVILFAEDDLNNFRATGVKNNTPALINRHTWSSSFCIPSTLKIGTYSNYTDNEAICISSGGPVDFVALADSVKQGFAELKTWLDSHTHAYLGDSGVQAVTTPPTASPTGEPANPSPDAPDVACKKLKVE